MKNYFTAVLLFIILFVFSPLYGQWLRYTIDDDLYHAMGVDIADIDADGDLDVAATSENNNSNHDVFWYENTNLTWQKWVVDTDLGGAIFVHAFDMDGDDDLDLVVNGFQPPSIVWYENDSLVWSKHVIDDTLNGCEAIAVADFDNDEDFDIAVSTHSAGEVFWYENDNLTWYRHIIDTSLVKAITVEAGGDIDGDNFLDVVVTDQDANDLFWYKNNGGGTSWTKEIIDTNLLGAFAFFIVDIDEDNKPDVIGTAKGIGEVVWYKNNLPSSNWSQNIIDPNLHDAHYPLVTDIDSDDDLDVVVTSMGGDELVWCENESLAWSKRLIDVTLDGPRIIDSADFNGDTKPDLVVTVWNGGKLVWYHNVIGVPHAYSVKCFPNYIAPQGDTLVINARLSNPENHPLEVHAIIYGEQSAFIDSIQLYDDGLHNDSLAFDNIWGNSKWLSGLLKDTYLMEVSVFDIADDILEKLYPEPTFTTIGPIVLEHFHITSSDTIPNHTDRLKYEFSLRNDDVSATANNITSQVVALDSFSIIYPLITTTYGNIQSGSTVLGNGRQYIEFDIDPHDTMTAVYKINIYSDGNLYWSDTFLELVINGLEQLEKFYPSEFNLSQNYPNPFNPITNIEFSIPKTEFVTLKIYNLLGQEVATLVSEKLKSGTYQYIWDASSLASGVYLYQLQAGNKIETRKIVLIR